MSSSRDETKTSEECEFSTRYSLLNELGKGAFSVVYKCKDVKTDEEFAVKVFRVDNIKPSELTKIHKEYDICRLVDHKNIVKTYGLYQTNRHIYIIFELINGGELFEQLVTKEFYSEKEASSVIECILSTIDYCHDLKIVHRDIKPENLLMATTSPDSDIKLADFGLAISVDDSEEKYYGYAGTPGYLAPEVIKRVPYSRPVDVWACGIILYMLLTGRFPFCSDDVDDMYGAILNEEINFEEEYWEKISDQAKSLVKAMLDKNQKSRITVKEALAHPWIKEREVVAKNEHIQDTVSEIRRLNLTRKMKRAIWSAIAANTLRRGLMNT